MTASSAERRAVHNRTYYENNRESVKARNKASRDRAAAFVFESKLNKPCLDCGGVFHPVCMDYDHVRGKKISNVSEGVTKGWSLGKLAEEIAKCDLVCANCHRLRTFKINHSKLV